MLLLRDLRGAALVGERLPTTGLRSRLPPLPETDVTPP